MWVSAREDLFNKSRDRQPEKFWFRDEEIDFFVSSIKETRSGCQFELTGIGTFTTTPITLRIYTSTESDMVELNFYSTG